MLLVAAVLAGLVVSCNGSRAIGNKLSEAENVMEQHPDSALELLRGIDEGQLKTKKERARYALLMSMALDKNYIDTATFDVLQPAIDYYLEKGTPDEKLKTYHYQGCIYYHAGENDKALQSFMHGESLYGEARDSLAYARLLSAKAQIYYDAYDYEKYTQLYRRVADICASLGIDKWYNVSLLSVLNGSLLMQDRNLSDSIMSICQARVDNGKMMDLDLYPYQLTHAKVYGTPTDIDEVLLGGKKFLGVPTETLLTIADGYRRVGDYSAALECLDSIQTSGKPYNKRKFIAIRTLIYEANGDYKNALRYYRVYNDSLFANHLRINEQNLKAIEERHEAEMRLVMENYRKGRLILICFAGLILLVSIVVTLYFIVRGLRMKKEIAVEKVRNAELENLKLRDAIAELEQTRDSLAESLKNKDDGLSEEVKQTVRTRIEMLNSILATQISANDRYEKVYEKWVETLLPDTAGFMNSNRLAFEASHPAFIKKLHDAGLTTDEINYACLYALGLNGKEVGNYMQRRGHVNISSGIRKKLGLDQHATNLNLYIRNLLKES